MTSIVEGSEGRETLSHRAMVFRRFSKHRLAVLSAWLLGVLYLIVLLADFIAPYSATFRIPGQINAPPQMIRLWDENGLAWPYAYALKRTRDPQTFAAVYAVDTSRKLPLSFLVESEPYRLLGIVESRIHLFGVDDGRVAIFGTDLIGRDLFSRTILASKVSLTVGLVGVVFSLFLGTTLGAIAGYFGGWVDTLIMRSIDLMMSLPTLPLWMGFAAAVPRTWGPLETYFAMTLILSLFGWTRLARVVRGKFLSVREEEFVLAAKLAGGTEPYIIVRHMIPSFISYIIVSLSLAVPSMIIGETVLSFLGLGLQAPAVSWGLLLKDAQTLQAVANSPWMLLPALFVMATVMAFNFVGDGLRDAADPLSHS